MKKKPRFVQIQNPRTKEWVRIGTLTGRIVGHRAKPYAAPIVRKSRERRSNPHTTRGADGRYRKAKEAEM